MLVNVIIGMLTHIYSTNLRTNLFYFILDSIDMNSYSIKTISVIKKKYIFLIECFTK